MTVEQNKIPDWAKRERQHDMEWISDNLHIFWPAATNAYVQAGRGVIIVDTTQQPSSEDLDQAAGERVIIRFSSVSAS